jgi:23S rRNA pseudouridine955/2504/2580 synthase
MKDVTVGPADHGKTVQSYLKQQFPIALVHKIFRKNGLRVNGVRAKEDMILKKGDTLKFFLDLTKKKPASPPTASLNRDFDILHEEEDFMILNKYPGIAVHEGETVAFQVSLIGQLRAAYKPKGITPLLVHRLDTNTSGCLIVAKNEASKTRFEEMFKAGEVEKKYRVLVTGIPTEKTGKITFSLSGRDGNLINALTLYDVEETFPRPGFSLIKAQIKTGRKHQIRLHFSRIHHPVLMDTLHGNFEANKRFKKEFGLKRQFLHASEVSFSWKGKTHHFNAPLNPDLDRVLKKLRSSSAK